MIFAFAAGGGGSYTPTPMARRHTRLEDEWQPRPRRRRAVFASAALAVLGAAVWYAPAVIVLTDLRDRPLEAVFAGIDGRVTSGAAQWRWWGTIEYRDVVLRDRKGRPLVAVPRVVIDRGLFTLLVRPTDLGAVRLVGGEALVEVRPGGSTIEDVLAPWLASLMHASNAPVSFELEVVDAAVELVDLARNDSWRITDVLAAGTVRPDATLAGWTISGRARHSGKPSRDLDAAANRIASDHLDRTTVAAGATAILARDGGWSVSSPDSQSPENARTLAVAATRLPLGLSSVAATRFDAMYALEGLADVRLDITLPPPRGGEGDETRRADGEPAWAKRSAVRVTGNVSGTELAVRDARTRAALVALDRGEMPIDLSVEGDRITVRSLKVASPLFKAEASGRIRLPAESTWDWAESLVGENFAVAAELDLAAAARSMPGGLKVRPDVRVTGGQLQLTAVARADGNERVLEVRASSRDVAAVQSVVTAPQVDGEGGLPAVSKREERLLRWNEPFTAWLRGRRGTARGDRVRIEEARIASPAVEVSGSGNAEASTAQWALDFDKLMAEAGEVLELEGVTLSGMSRGRIDLVRIVGTAASHAKISASFSNFEFVRPGRPPWRDAELSVAAEGSGGLSGAALLVDQARAVVTAADDSCEMTLTGGALVNLRSLLASRASIGRGTEGPWLRAAPGAQAITADCSLTGDLARWQPRWETLVPAAALEGVELGGTAKASAVLEAQGGSWRITRAGGEVEKLTVTCDGRRIQEPRAVASAAGQWNPATGQIEISSAELLTPTLSLRTGGLSLRVGSGGVSGDRPGDVLRAVELVERLRGKLQWQADVARLERWLVPPHVASRWPAAGRAWGTAEILDTPIGMNLLVEATGSQLAISGPPNHAESGAAVATGADQVTPVSLWSEPRATLLLEVTCPPGVSHERLAVNQLKLESSTIVVAAAGGIAELSSRLMVELGGSVAYDWAQVSRLLTPWTGGRLRLAGSASRPFTLRVPLGDIVVADAATVGTDGQPIVLPDDWLPSAEGTRSDRVSRVALPRTQPVTVASALTLADRVRAVSIDTSAAWTAADLLGFQFAPGEMPLRFFEGQLAFGPFDVAASGGRLRGSPWLRLLPAPGELVVPPGRCLDRVVLTRQMCDRWVNWLVPLIGHSTHTQGLMSVDLGGVRLPLDDPFGGQASGQIIFENLEATPGENVRPLVNLITKLQTAIDPRFAFGDKVVLLRVRPEPVAVRLADRRLWHEGLVMDSGPLVIRSGGSVGADGTLAMVVEIAFRGDIAGAAPVVGTLLRTPLVIPLKGTVSRPQFDARSIDVIVARVMENTAEALIGPKLSRDLETLFGNPPPAEAAPPQGAGGLSFPQAP